MTVKELIAAIIDDPLDSADRDVIIECVESGRLKAVAISCDDYENPQGPVTLHITVD